MVRLLHLKVFDKVKEKVVKSDEEPLNIAAANDCILISTSNGSIKAYSHDLNKILFSFQTKNKDIFDLNYCYYDDSIITIENESDDSAIKVARHYLNWRQSILDSNSNEASQVISYDLIASRSIRYISVDNSVDYHYSQDERLSTNQVGKVGQKETPFFQILISTDDAISLYRIYVNTSIPIQDPVHIDSSLRHSENHFNWIFSLKASANRISLCGDYLSYSSHSQVFVIKFTITQDHAEERLLSVICKSAIESTKDRSSKTVHNSLILSNTPLKRIKRLRKKTSNTNYSRNGSFVNQGNAKTKGATITQGYTQTTTMSWDNPVNNTVEDSKHHMQLEFDRHGVKNKLPYSELPLPIKSSTIITTNPNTQLSPQLSSHFATTTNADNPYASEIIGPIRDFHSFQVNTEEDWSLLSSEIVFFKHISSNLADSSDDEWVNLGNSSISRNSTKEDEEANFIHSLNLIPVFSHIQEKSSVQKMNEASESDQKNFETNSKSKTNSDSNDHYYMNNKLVGVRIFASCSQKGFLWIASDNKIIESTTYSYPSPTHRAIATGSFLYGLTQNELQIYLMRNLELLPQSTIDSNLNSSNSYRSSNQSSNSLVTSLSTLLESEIQSQMNDSKKTNRSNGAIHDLSKTLVSQTTEPILFGVIEYLGLNQLCVSQNGSIMILCKSTEDEILKRCNLQLGRSRESSNPNNHQNSNNNHQNASKEKDMGSLGWNMFALQLNSPFSAFQQFNAWTSIEEITQSELDLLIESWNYFMSVIKLGERLMNLKSKQIENASNRVSTCQTSWISEKDIIEAKYSLKKIYGKLATLEYEASNVARASLFWSLSDVVAEQVVGQLVQKMKTAKEKRNQFILSTCVQYLKMVLLGTTQRIDLIQTAPLADLVYAILSMKNAALLGQVVLESPINDFNIDNTIVLLEKTMIELEQKIQQQRLSSVASSFLSSAVLLDTTGKIQSHATPLELFYRTQTEEENHCYTVTLALIVLLLKRDSIDNSEQLQAQRSASFKGTVFVSNPQEYLKRLPDSFLVPYLCTYHQLMFKKPSKQQTAIKKEDNIDNEQELTGLQEPSQLALLIAENIPWTCLEILVTAGVSIFSAEFALKLLGQNQLPHLQTALKCCYFESQILLKWKPSKSAQSSVATKTLLSQPKKSVSLESNLASCLYPLIDIYLENINLNQDDVTKLLSYSIPDIITQNNPHFTQPAASLEAIWKEFHREYFMDSQHKYLMGLPPFSTLFDSQRPQESIKEKHFYLSKLQGLLSALADRKTAGLDIKHIIHHTLEALSKHDLPSYALESIDIICRPMIGGFKETVSKVVKNYPATLLKFLKKQLYVDDLELWRITLEVILSEVNNNHQKENVKTLEDALKFMARHLSSKDFLDLLPANGNVSFFLPYIELNLSRNSSLQLLEEIQALK